MRIQIYKPFLAEENKCQTFTSNGLIFPGKFIQGITFQVKLWSQT